MSIKSFTVGGNGVAEVSLGPERLFLIAGPCVIEGRDICFQIAERLKAISDKLGLPYIFKASFDKANRTSHTSFRGPGLQTGLEILAAIRAQFGVPVVADIHTPEQAPAAGEVLDMIQIPAFLVRQTDLVESAALTGKPVQLKKAQFMAPGDMQHVIGKVTAHGNDRITLVERGTFFGYNRLVCDMAALAQMRELGYPAVIDATHSTQQPGGLGSASGGSPALAHILARAATAAGADGLFLETHPDPAQALSDAACMLPLDEIETLLTCCRDIHTRIRQD